MKGAGPKKVGLKKVGPKKGDVNLPPGTPPEVVVVGAGHNGLIAALRLARAGCRVTVLEQGVEAGGCVWTERRHDGVLVERGAYEHGGVLATALELGLDDPALGDRAVRYREHPVVAGFIFGDGHRLVFHTDLDATVGQLGADGPAYRRLVDLSAVLFSMLDAFDTPPTPTAIAASLAQVPGGDELFRTLLLPAETVLEMTLTDPYLRAALALQASHAQVPAWSPGTGLFALLLPASHSGPAVRPDGGSRALIDALLAALEAAGATVTTDAAVVRIAESSGPARDVPAQARTRSPAASTGNGAEHGAGNGAEHGAGNGAGQVGRAGVFGGGLGGRVEVPGHPASLAWTDRAEVETSDGSIIHADAVISSIGLPRTTEVLQAPAPAMHAAARGLHSGHFNVCELTITVVTRTPVALPFEDADAVWYAVASPEDIRRGFGEVLAGQLPSSPWAMVGQIAQPADVTGGAVWLSSIVPLRLADETWTPELEQATAERIVDQIGAVLGVDLRDGLVELVVSGPATWAARTGGDGNPNHLDNTIDQLLGWRPPGHADTRTELPWLYLCGAGQHPGGGLSGVSGSAAAAAVLTPRGAKDTATRRAMREVRGLRKGFTAYRAMRKGVLR